MIEAKSFLYELDSATGVATITLNRPDRLNALTFEIYRELAATFRALDTEPGVRAIILTGQGRAFCSGGDVEDIIGALLGRYYFEKKLGLMWGPVSYTHLTLPTSDLV